MALTEREKTILRLKAKGLSDYKIGRKLKIDPANVTHSRENASRKLERAKAGIIFFNNLKEQSQPKENNLILKEGENLRLCLSKSLKFLLT